MDKRQPSKHLKRTGKQSPKCDHQNQEHKQTSQVILNNPAIHLSCQQASCCSPVCFRRAARLQRQTVCSKPSHEELPLSQSPVAEKQSQQSESTIFWCSRQQFLKKQRNLVVQSVFRRTSAACVLLHPCPQTTCRSPGGAQGHFEQNLCFLIQTELSQSGIAAPQ